MMRSMTPEEWTANCRRGLDEARRLLPAILEGVADPLAAYNDLLIAVGSSGAAAGLFSEVHPDEAIRDAARTVEQDVSAFVTDLNLDRPLYDALAAVDAKSLDAESARFLTQTLRDFRRAGVDQDEPTRARIKQINEELTKLGQQFSKTLAEDVRAIAVDDPARLSGLPQDWIDAHKTPAGGYRITTDYPDYNPFMMYADDDELRRQLYVAFRSRGDVANEQILRDILTLRAELSTILGYASWADYVTEDKMMKSAAAAGDFIERITALARARAARDYDELLERLRRVDPAATRVQDWQKTWLEHLVKKERYEVDGQKVRAYFPFEQVLAGLLDITATIFELSYAPIAVEVWHPSVRAFEVRRAGAAVGRIFLDMHPREGKYKHAAQFTLRDGVAGRHLPEGVLVCNFPSGGELLEHEDVVTMFHEFGHLMHHVLGGGHRWVRHSGVATEWDFVEAPSQMLEEWAWNHETLARFAKDAAGEVIPEALVAKMREADTFGLGTHTLQQMFYASISLRFHTTDPKALDQLALVRELQARYTPFGFVEGTRFHASFGHLVGYSAMYYTYMWSLVIAKDLLTPFARAGLMDPTTTRKYRDTILAPGGTKDAAVLVKDFLGREFDFAAFEEYLSA
jgi:thimet oligopeptidase